MNPINNSNYETDLSAISNLIISQNKSVASEKTTKKMKIDPKKIKNKKRLRHSKDNNGSKKDLNMVKFRKLALQDVQKSARGEECSTGRRSNKN